MTSLRLSLIELYAGSDIISMNVLGQSIIVIDKYETAVELLEKRSGIYSSRFVSIMPVLSSRASRLMHRVGLSLRCLNSSLDGVTVLFSCPMVIRLPHYANVIAHTALLSR